MGFLEGITGVLGSTFQIGLSVVTTLTATALGLDVDRPVVTSGWGGRVVTITAADSPYTPSDCSAVLCDCTAGPITISLPALATYEERVFFLKKIDGTSNEVTVSPNGAETLNGVASSYVVSAPDDGIWLTGASATNWQISGTVSRSDLLTVYTDTYGDGSSGDATVAGTTTLAADAYYGDLEVTGTLNIAGYQLYVRDRISGNGTIAANGVNAVAGTGATAPSSGTVGTAGSGANGGTGAAGGNSATQGNSYAAFGGASGGDGGVGGASGGGQAGGVVQGASAPATTVGDEEDATPFLFASWSGTGAVVAGGSGGSGGGGTAGSTGGGGGSGGAVAWIRARVMDFTGTVSAVGGNGGDATLGAGAGAGGGGGGGGGAILVTTEEERSVATYTVAGGAGGAGVGTGANGNAGNAGKSKVVTRVTS